MSDSTAALQRPLIFVIPCLLLQAPLAHPSMLPAEPEPPAAPQPPPPPPLRPGSTQGLQTAQPSVLHEAALSSSGRLGAGGIDMISRELLDS